MIAWKPTPPELVIGVDTSERPVTFLQRFEPSRSINLNELCSRAEEAISARPEHWFMLLREHYPEPEPPGGYYCLSFSRGDAIRSLRFGRAGVGAIAALALLSFTWTASVTLYIAFHDDLMGAILARQVEMK